jgi:O-antigen/teichoic acid export membrane protein
VTSTEDPAPPAPTATGRLTARLEALAERRLGANFHLVRGSFGVMASTILASATGWLFWVAATHRWPPGQIGIATSLVAALTSIALIAGQPVATTMLMRLPRSERRGGLLGAGLAVAVALALAESAVAIAVLPGSVRDVRTPGVGAMFAVGAAAAAAGIVLDASSLAIRRPGFMVARNGMHGAGKLALLVAVAIPAGLISGPFAVVGAWATLSVLTSLWEWDRWHRAERERSGRSVDPATARRRGFADLREGFGLQVIGSLGGSLPPQVLPILVVGILDTRQAAFFSITWLVGSLCFFISPAVCQALLAEGSLTPEALDQKTRAAVLLSSALLAVPVLVYVAFGSVVLGLFGAGYAAHGTTLLVILAVSSVPDLVTNVAVARYRVQRRLGAAAVVNGVIAAVAVAGTAWALPRYGIDGAGWAWTAAEVIGCAVLLVLVGVDRLVGARGDARAAGRAAGRPGGAPA